MRYVFVSDIHGKFDLLVEALNGVNFNKEKDTLVSVGDPFDRGPASKEVLDYLLSCPNRILIWGNHDARLRQLVFGLDYIAGFDISNGVPETLESFTHMSRKSVGLDTMIYALNFPQNREVRDKLFQYFHECCWAIEFKDLIATHAWLPINEDTKTHGLKLKADWRKTTWTKWFDASWAHSQNLSKRTACYPEKPLLIGHWHAWRLAQEHGHMRTINAKPAWGEHVNCDTFILGDKKLIAIDGCSNYPYGGKVNAYVYKSYEEPIKHFATSDGIYESL